MGGYSLYAVKSGTAGGHLARKSTSNARHLCCGLNILSPDDYRGYYIGKYQNNNPYEGFHTFGPPKNSICNTIIGQAISMILNDTGFWIKGAFVPPFASTCGTCGIGCTNGSNTASLGMDSGCWILVPNKHFTLPAGKVATAARIRIKGYSDRFIDCQKFRSGTSNVNKWSYSFRDYMLNNSISGTEVTPKGVAAQQYTSTAAECVLANCHWDRTQLPVKRAFFTRSGHNVPDHGAEVAYDTMLAGVDPHCVTNHSMQYYLQGMISETSNPTFAGLIGCNTYPNGGNTQNWTNAFPMLAGNDGTVTHRSWSVKSVEWGEFKEGANGTFMKQIGAHWYNADMLPSASKSDTTWNVLPYIELPAHHVRWLNNNGGLWIMLSMPAPFFNTTDVAEINGGARQIWIEDYKLEVDYQQ